ncbi:MAG: SGNH/GDSL hydrolase family protein [bacterium]|nr:SGNH/GDSL hydrolase family protein [bacterium]
MENDKMTDQEKPQKKRFRINLHMVLIASVLLVLFTILFRFRNWGEFISQDDIRDNIEGTYEDNLDLMVPLTDEDGMPIPLNTEDGLSIVFFGNAPLADDRDSQDNLVAMIGEMTGATVYNCSIGKSYLAAERNPLIWTERPMDAYTFYWLAVYAGGAGKAITFERAADVLGENIPEDAQEALDTLASVDFSTVDVIAVMYDAYDYLIGHPMYNDDDSTDITTFTGNLEAGIEYLQSVYPHIRIIVMSPTYSFSNEIRDGEYVSSDQVRYGRDVLSTYSIMEGSSCSARQVSFIDNLYGTVTEDNAKDYLIDNRHLNVEGRRLVAERFVYALNYYEEDD